MNFHSQNQIEVPVSGEAASLGMLYDINRKQLLSAITLWSAEALKSNVTSHDCGTTEETFESLDKTNDKTGNVNLGLQADVSGETILFGGGKASFKHSNDDKHSKRQDKAVFKFRTTTVHRQLTMEHLGPNKIEYPEVLDEDNATHVVVGIKYGGEVIMNFFKDLEEEKKSKSSEALLNIVKDVFLTNGSRSGSEKEEIEKITCQFYSNFHIDTRPTNLKEAVELFKKLPSIIGPDKIGVPLMLTLEPLKNLHKNICNTTEGINATLVHRVFLKKKGLESLLASCENLIPGEGFPFHSKTRQLDSFLKYVHDYKNYLKDKSSQLRDNITYESVRNDNLEAFLREQESSVFSDSSLTTWLDRKKEEMKVMQGILNLLKDTPFVSSGELECYLLQPDIYHVVCLVFKRDERDAQLLNMKAFLEDSQQEIEEAPPSTPILTHLVRDSLNRFRTLKDDNKRCQVASFVAIEEPFDSKESPEIFVRYYYKGEPKEYLTMAKSKEIWQDIIRNKLVEMLAADNCEDLCRILLFLDEEDKAYKDNSERPYAPHWKLLKARLNSDEAFRALALRLSEDTKRAITDQKYRNYLSTLHEEMMTHCDETVAIETFQNYDRKKLWDLGVAARTTLGSLARVLDKIPAQSRNSFINSLKTMASRSDLMLTGVDELANLAKKGSGTVVMVGLAAVHLTFSVLKNIWLWWNDKITGKRCIKNILDGTFTTGSGMLGGVAGAAIGACGGPIGILAGGIVCGIISAAAMSYLSDYFTQNLFGLPQAVALENAYRYLGVKMTASNAQVNTAFHGLCLKHHPDKGGKKEDFFILQNNMQIIKEARGKY